MMRTISLKNKKQYLSPILIAILGVFCVLISPAAADDPPSSKPDVNEAKIETNFRNINENSAAINDITTKNDSQLQLFIGVLFGAAIVSRVADYVVSRFSQGETLNEIQQNVEKQLPALVNQAVNSRIDEATQKNELIEQEILFMQYELADLSISQFEFEREFYLRYLGQGYNSDALVKRSLKQARYNARAIQTLERIQHYTKQMRPPNADQICDTIGERITSSLKSTRALVAEMEQYKNQVPFKDFHDFKEFKNDIASIKGAPAYKEKLRDLQQTIRGI
ncbi:hypothetical protein N836_23135 [Leptolyngbya sp. Heron Island J]|uniref:hypothetical protein n=1 Tax=Leptolyngbya sp. Heron Island J TaxID=1385935 RepID=UPI0003B9AD09|nr:hypothetical protein [Leptolyngbya sp. Heron Island J]ESA32961.1 hypothetical protein N836_23135 [Leptolyngbya sp. Heron Island J]